MTHYLDFEKPLAEIEGKAEELRNMARKNVRLSCFKIFWNIKIFFLGNYMMEILNN